MRGRRSERSSAGNHQHESRDHVRRRRSASSFERGAASGWTTIGPATTSVATPSASHSVRDPSTRTMNTTTRPTATATTRRASDGRSEPPARVEHGDQQGDVMPVPPDSCREARSPAGWRSTPSPTTTRSPRRASEADRDRDDEREHLEDPGEPCRGRDRGIADLERRRAPPRRPARRASHPDDWRGKDDRTAAPAKRRTARSTRRSIRSALRAFVMNATISAPATSRVDDLELREYLAEARASDHHDIGKGRDRAKGDEAERRSPARDRARPLGLLDACHPRSVGTARDEFARRPVLNGSAECTVCTNDSRGIDERCDLATRVGVSR